MSEDAQLSGFQKRKREMERLEAQRNGEAPPDLDEDGKVINPHIPQYMADAPWYQDTGRRGLKHQRKPAIPEEQKLDETFEGARNEVKVVHRATRYRKGACENCGSFDHKRRDCLERQRKRGAKFTGKDIAADTEVKELKLGFEAKRDNWNNVVAEDHMREVMERHELLEKKRAEVVAQKMKQLVMAHHRVTDDELNEAVRTLKAKLPDAPASLPPLTSRTVVAYKPLAQEAAERLDAEDHPKAAAAVRQALARLLSLIPCAEGGTWDDEDAAHLFEKVDGGAAGKEDLAEKVDTGGVRDSFEAKVTTRKLGLREDIAKYLKPCFAGSGLSHYDPKTRSLRTLGEDGDNWANESGDARTIDSVMQFSAEATRRLREAGHDGKYITLAANPTQTELAFRRDKELKKELQAKKASALEERYGGAEHLQELPDELRFASEAYVEYRPDGSVLKGVEAAVPRSKYDEDAYTNQHTEVFGSYWVNGKWGYACCRSTDKRSFCSGSSSAKPAADAAGGAGEEAAAAAAAAAAEVSKEFAEAQRRRQLELEVEKLEQQLLDQSAPKTAEEEEAAKKKAERKRKRGLDNDRERRERAIAEIEASGRRVTLEYLEAMGVEATEEDLREFKRQRVNPQDPMAEFVDKDE